MEKIGTSAYNMPEDQGYYKNGFLKSVSDTHNWRNVANAVPYIIPYLNKNQKLLDVGCGPGLILADLTEYVGEVVGVEPNQEILDLARLQSSNPKLSFEVGSAYLLPFKDNTFDVVHALQVIIHLEDPVKGLQEMARVCKSGGYVCVKDADMLLFGMYPEKYSNSINKYFSLRHDGSTTSTNAGRALKGRALEAGYPANRVCMTASTWCASSESDRKRWASMYINRLKSLNELDKNEYEEVIEDAIEAWSLWAEDAAGIIIMVHGEMVYQKP